MSVPENQMQTGAQSGEDKPSVEDLKRQYFKPSEGEKASQAIEKARQIAEANNLPVAFNWDAEKEPLPEKYGVAIVPVTQRREGIGIVPIGLYIAGIPDPELIKEHEKGESWVRAVIVDRCMNKLSNAVRPRGDNQQAAMSVPFSVEDFITTASRDQGLSFFREYGPTYVKALKKLGLRVMNMTLLRQVLASASFAEQQFPNVSQDKWEGILDKMLREASEEDTDPGIVKQWRETRNTTALETGDFELDELDQLIAD